jgi:hypothetical protein
VVAAVVAVVVVLLLLLPSVASRSAWALLLSLSRTRISLCGCVSRLVLAELCCWLAWLKAVRGISCRSEWLSLSETLSTREAE